MEKAMLVFQTDFTYKEGAVCAMYGVVKSVDRTLDIIDGTHEIPQYDIWSASYRLMQSMRFWPEGTVFVSVVDPGVGTDRKACVARTKDGYYIVTPDNGSLTHIYDSIVEVRQIDESVNRLRGKDNEDVTIFHGRDLFGYCAARLASGIIDFEGVGPAYDVNEIVRLEIQQPVRVDSQIKGCFEINDPNFGNLWTNIPTSLFDEAGFKYGDLLHMVVTNKDEVIVDGNFLYHSSFGDAPKGSLMIYRNELNKIGVAVVMGSAASEYGLSFGHEWKVSFERGK